MVVGLSTLSSPTQKTNHSRYRTSPRGVFFHVYIYCCCCFKCIHKGREPVGAGTAGMNKMRKKKKKKTVLFAYIYINVRLQGRREVARQRSAGSSFLPPSMKREGSCPAVALYLHKLHRVYNSQVRLGASPLAVCSHPNFQGNFLLLFSGRFGEG